MSSSCRKTVWNFTRKMASFLNTKPCKVCLLGAGGGIGSHLALMLKMNKYITDIALYEIKNSNGLREDLSHIDTTARVHAYDGTDQTMLVEALKCSSLVVIVAGHCHSLKYQTREAMFDGNAQLILDIMKATVQACHSNMPFIHVVTNPVNTLVPLCGEYLMQVGSFDKKKLSGSTSIDSLRARTFLGQLLDCDPSKLQVPVVGGHSAGSITPLVSQSKPKFNLKLEVQKKLADRIISGAEEVVKAKEQNGAAQLSMAHCVSKFCNSFCRAFHGEKDVVEVGFIPANVNELEYFACSFTMDKNGVKDCHQIPPMSDYEKILYDRAIQDIQKNITKAKEFLSKQKSEQCKKT